MGWRGGGTGRRRGALRVFGGRSRGWLSTAGLESGGIGGVENMMLHSASGTKSGTRRTLQPLMYENAVPEPGSGVHKQTPSEGA